MKGLEDMLSKLLYTWEYNWHEYVGINEAEKIKSDEYQLLGYSRDEWIIFAKTPDEFSDKVKKRVLKIYYYPKEKKIKKKKEKNKKKKKK